MDRSATHELLREIFFLVKSGIRANLPYVIRNPGLWNPESGIRNPTKDWNPEFHGPLTKTGIQYLESRIHSVKSGIQDEDGATLS